jgi:hypothetical protein
MKLRTLVGLACGTLVLSATASAQLALEKPLSYWSQPSTTAPGPDATTYSYDDGTPENSIGWISGGDLCWMTWFDPIGGADTLTQISTMNGTPGSMVAAPIGATGGVAVWDDPDANGNPINIGGVAVLLEQKPWTITQQNTGMLENIPISPTIVTRRFFIGGWLKHAAGQFVAPLDTSQVSSGRCWLAGSTNPALPFNPKHLGSNPNKPVPLPQGNPSFDGVWVLRAEGTGDAPTKFCTAKPGLACGVPTLTTSGVPSATAGSGFTVTSGPARTCRSGILLYNTNFINGVPFQGGTLCVDSMGLRRAGSTNSMGTPGGANCDGAFSIDMNTFAVGNWVVPNCDGTPSGIAPNNPAAFLTVAGTQVSTQWWGRDSVATGSFVSEAVRFTIGP